MRHFIILILVLVSNGIQAQIQIDESKIENFVFEGVGTRGVAMVGALQAIEDNGKFTNIKRVAGVSSGSIISLLYALKYTSEDIKKILFDLNFGDLLDKPCIFRIKKKFGYYKGKKFELLLKKYIANSKLNLSEDATFADLNMKNTVELYVFSANLNTYSLNELSNRKTPNIKLWEAVRASISLPIVFPAWRFTQGTNPNHLYVDGGIIYDFPINFFDEPPFNKSEKSINHSTLGFQLHNKALDEQEGKLHYGSPLKDYLNSLTQIIVHGQTSVIDLNPEEKSRVVVIEINGDTSFSLTDQQKQDLYDRGVKYTNQFLDHHVGN